QSAPRRTPENDYGEKKSDGDEHNPRASRTHGPRAQAFLGKHASGLFFEIILLIRAMVRI
ncbi:MAG TPA: hypothetical protein VGC99_22255, partial [Candidatus Tectomicrobia bacterium]